MQTHGLRLVDTTASEAPVTPTRDKVSIKPKARRQAVRDFIRSARASLLVSVFRCDDLSILHELGEAVARGVRVEVLVTGRAKGWSKRLGPLAGCLQRMGVVVNRVAAGGMKYHAKFMVADDAAALIGTLNLTRKCFRRTRDFLVITHDRAVVAGLAAAFRADAQGVPMETLASDARLILGPESARERIESLLGSARQSIRIMDHKLSDPAVLAILRDRRRHGVNVEIHNGSHGDELNAHGRLIVVDGAVAVFGSFALSPRSLDARREAGIIIEDADLVSKLNRQFDKLALKPAAASAAAA
jgi:phosphatidylserine/phosphatidylglycerophosphate/cardiolipin synthase-like enzyme